MIDIPIEGDGVDFEPIHCEQQIDGWFQEGERDAETLPLEQAQSKYEEGSIAHKWYTRGFAHKMRLLRAIECETKQWKPHISIDVDRVSSDEENS